MIKLPKLLLLFGTSILLAGCWNQGNNVNGSESSAPTSQSGSSSKISESKDGSSSKSTSSSKESSEVDEELAIADYFPLTNNYEAVFKGTGNEFAGFTRKYDFIDGDYVQMRSDNGGTSMVNIYRVDETGVYEIFSRGEFYVRENYISRVKSRSPEQTILKAPLKVGTTWEDSSGSHVITSLNKMVTVPFGKFEALEVTETSDNFVTKQYFAKDIGLIKTEYTSTEGESFQIISELSTLETDGWQEQVVMYQLTDDANGLKKVNVNLDIVTNDAMRRKFTELMSGGQGLQKMVPAGTQIQALYTNWHFDPTSNVVNADFSEEIEHVQGSAAIILVYPAVMMTLAEYYSSDTIIPTVNNQPLTINQVGQLEPGEPFTLDYSLVVE